jgi:uncharacterized protein
MARMTMTERKILRRAGLLTATLAIGMTGLMFAPHAAAQALTRTASKPPHSVAMTMELDVPIPMRDNVTLAARIWRPNKPGRFPVVMQHTPYISDETQQRARKFVAADYVYVSLDRRGRGVSEGVFVPLEGTGADGADAIAWLARQPWSDGRVVTMGGSYRGTTQWQTMAYAAPAHKAAVPTASVYPGWDYPSPRGIPYAYMAQWLAFTAGRSAQPQLFADEAYWRDFYIRTHSGEWPFAELAKRSGAPQAHFARWLAHPGYDAYWARVNPTPQQYAQMQMPILTITGYFDGDQEGALRYYREHLAHASESASRRHLLLIGPWDHAGTRYPRDQVGGLKFNPRAVLDLDALHIQWFDHLLRDGPLPSALADRANYYVMGAEEWRSASSIDTIAPKTWTLYPRSEAAGSDRLFGGGRLLDSPAEKQQPSRYLYDPRKQTQPEDWALRPIAEDEYVGHADALSRPQLFFHSEPLTHARTICGQIVFDARIAIDVPDTDIRVDLHAIDRENRILWLGGDRMRARFRADLGRETLASAGEIQTWRFDRFWWTCRRLEAGTWLRLTVGPLDDPYFQKNLNTGGRVGYERMADARIATVALYHDHENPTALRLPVIEND